MASDFFSAHQDTLERAVEATATREYWTPFPEMPSPRVYGEDAAAKGQAAFESYQNADFPLELDGSSHKVGQEQSPYGFDLKVRYPYLDAHALIDQSSLALDSWREAGPEAWVGVCLEALHRLNQHSFEIAHAVQHTSGQAFMMAFQAGGPHAQDRGLEAVTYAWQNMSRILLFGYHQKTLIMRLCVDLMI